MEYYPAQVHYCIYACITTKMHHARCRHYTNICTRLHSRHVHCCHHLCTQRTQCTYTYTPGFVQAGSLFRPGNKLGIPIYMEGSEADCLGDRECRITTGQHHVLKPWLQSRVRAVLPWSLLCIQSHLQDWPASLPPAQHERVPRDKGVDNKNF